MEKRCDELGVAYVDSPISGGSVKAANGQLSIMAAATPAAFEAAHDSAVATVYARNAGIKLPCS